MIKVLGHLAPDTDSTCAPIVYAWYLAEHKNMDAKAVVTGKPGKEADFVLEKMNFAAPELISNLEEGDKIVIVDTNNPEELLSGWDKAEIIEIVDHHKLAGLTTSSPVRVTIEPLACTMTVIYNIFEKEGITEIPKEIAGLMLAAILSDTLKFTSPTTTDRDKEVAAKLEKLAEINIDEFATEMFEAKSDLTGMSSKDLLLSDSKIFEMGGKKIRVGVLETTKPSNALSMQTEINDSIELLKTEEKLDGLFFFIVDIIKSQSHLLVGKSIESELAVKAFGGKFENEIMVLPGVVSRKKQMVPNIEKAVA